MNGASLDNSFQNYVLVGAGIVAAVWFFAGYPSQEPRSAIQLSTNREAVELQAVEKLSEIGYSVGDFLTEVSFRSENRLLDSLQHTLGRDSAIQVLKAQAPANIKPYFWQIRFRNPASSVRDNSDIDEPSGEGPPINSGDESLTVRVDTKGQVFELRNNSEWLPANTVRPDVLQAVLPDSTDKETIPVLSSVPDSLLRQIFHFDFQEPSAHAVSRSEQRNALIAESIQKGIPYRLSVQEAGALAGYYVKEMGWNLEELVLDTAVIQRVNSLNAAQVRFRSDAPVMGQHIRISAQITPTGSLIGIQSQYNSSNNSFDSWENIWAVIRGGLIFIFGLGSIIIFFFRIRARAIDTQSALVVAILAGLIIPTYILLESLNEVQLFNGSGEWMEAVMLIIGMGVAGAFSSIAFFILFAISDSITRQHWSEKLSSYDYLRQGMIFNKPVGLVVLRSLVLAFILAGIWTAALWFLPDLYMHFDHIFYQGAVVFPPLYLLLEISWFSFCMIIIIFLIIGSQVYAQTKNRWLTGVITILSCGIVIPALGSFGPPVAEFMLGTILGTGLTLIYLRWDFLTVLFSHFLFLGLLGSSSGWVIPGSLDIYLFAFYLFFMLFVFTGGTLALFKGKEERVLPKYIPEYVEELAQEERIKQELQIARQVQQSFLPAKTPDIKGLDIAALCRPAYETGGDYYDFIQLDEHRIALTIGDVSGKGIQAAFYMTFTKGILHSLCRETDSPAELLIKTNRLFCDNVSKGTFISLVYGIIDLKEQTFTFARGGHNPIIRINSANGQVEELQPTGLGLGLTKDESFSSNIREVQLSLSKNDILVLYTDGIVEALSEARRFYGNKRLVSVLQQNKENSSPQILSALFDDVITFTGKAKQHDDMTIMIVKLKEPQS